MSSRRTKSDPHAVCSSCGLLAPEAGMGVWSEKLLCRRMAVGGHPEQAPSRDQWTEGLWRYYYVTHDHRVCGPCLQRLQAGGKFKERHRSRWAFVVLAAILVSLVLCLPVILPKLASALWLTSGGR